MFQKGKTFYFHLMYHDTNAPNIGAIIWVVASVVNFQKVMLNATVRL